MIDDRARKMLEQEIAIAREHAVYHRGLAEGMERKAEILERGLVEDAQPTLRFEDDGGNCADAGPGGMSGKRWQQK